MDAVAARDRRSCGQDPAAESEQTAARTKKAPHLFSDMSDSRSAARSLYEKAKQVVDADTRACLNFLLQAYEIDHRKKYMDKIIQLREIIAESDPAAESSDSESSDDIIIISECAHRPNPAAI